MNSDNGIKRGSKAKRLLVFSWLASALLIATSIACSKRYDNLPAFSAIPFGDPVNQSVGRFKTSYLADQIHAYFRGQISGPIAVTTFVDLDDLNQSSTFGRVVGEQLISELAMRGYNVIEIRMAEAMQIMDHKGEFGLSRQMPLLKDSQQLSALVVGTYVVSPQRVYLNTRVIDPASATIISAGSVEMRKTAEIAQLVRSNSFPPSLERIPVRHFGYSTYPAPYYWPYYGYGMPAFPGMRKGDSEEWTTPEAPKPSLPPQSGGHASQDVLPESLH